MMFDMMMMMMMSTSLDGISSLHLHEDLSGVTEHSTLYRAIVKYAMVLHKYVQNVYQ